MSIVSRINLIIEVRPGRRFPEVLFVRRFPDNRIVAPDLDVLPAPASNHLPATKVWIGRYLRGTARTNHFQYRFLLHFWTDHLLAKKKARAKLGGVASLSSDVDDNRAMRP